MTGFETLAIHAGQEPDPQTGAVVPPIHQASTYKQDGVGGPRGGYEYSRTANPTRTALEECLAALEGGTSAFAFASGLAAEDCLLRAACRPGDHVVIPTDAYGGTFRLFAKVLERWGITHEPVADRRRRRRRGAAARRPAAKIVWVETPTNPLLGITDIARARRGRARRTARSWSSTTPSPRPTCSSRWSSAPTSSCTRPPSTWAATPTWSAARWSPPTPDWPRAWRSTRTRWAPWPGRSTPGWCCAASRRSRCGWTGTARTPSGSRRCSPPTRPVTRVHYPGLPEHPGHEIAKAQMRGFGGMVSFRVARRARQQPSTVCARDPAVHAGRVPRRRGVADRAPGPDDARVGRRVAAGGPGRPGAAVGRHRGRRRPARRPGAGHRGVTRVAPATSTPSRPA